MGSVFYNSLLTVLWAGLVISTALDWGDYDALECPRPWQLFLVVDYGLVFVMCLMDLIGSYCTSRDRYEKLLWWATRVAGVNYTLLALWLVVGTWFLIEDYDCLDHVLDEDSLFSVTVRVSGLIWVILRWLLSCFLLCAVAQVVRALRRQGNNAGGGQGNGDFALVRLHRSTNFRALRNEDDDDNIASAA